MSERDVLKSCKYRLDYWQMQKVCIWWDRLNSGRMQFEGRYVYGCKPGTPDLVAYLSVGKVCHIVFFECKKDAKAKQSVEQKNFESKFNCLDNAHYMVVTDPDQVDALIDKITNFHNNQIEQMGKVMGL